MSLLDISKCFTEENLKKIVTDKFGPEASYIGWRFSGGFKKGDSYLSEVFKVVIDATTATNAAVQIHTVIKSVPKNVGRRKTFRSGDFFRNEINFYQTILKAFRDYLQCVQPGKDFGQIGVCLAAFFDGENDWIVMEDLTFEGFGTASRTTGMDFNHFKVAFEALGKFHGMSLAMKHQRPEEFQRLLEHNEETYYAPHLKSWYKEFQLTQEIVARHAVQNEFPDSIYLEKMEAFFAGDLYDKMCEMCSTRNQYSVFLHGDCWTPNFLFKYDADGSTPLQAKIIDFQLARYASPALDISFFLYSCTTQETREQHYDEWLRAYHDSLSELLKSFGVDPETVFPYSALLDELKESARFGVGMGIESIPFSVLEEGIDIDQIKGDAAVPLHSVFVIKPIEDQPKRRRLADMFKHAVDCGYLD